MSLGDYEHTFQVVLRVSIRSKSEKPTELETQRMWDVAQYYGEDGVEIDTPWVEYMHTRDLLPPEVRNGLHKS